MKTNVKDVIHYLMYNKFKNKLLSGELTISRLELLQYNSKYYTQDENIEIIQNKYYIHHSENSPDFIDEFKGQYKYDGSFYTILNNVNLCGKFATGKYNNKFIEETTLGSKGYLVYKNDLRSLKFNHFYKNELTLNYALSLVNCLNNNYYHFVTEALPLIEAYKKFHNENKSTNVNIIINSNAPTFVYEWLKLLGINKEQIIEWNYKKITVRNCILPSLRYLRLEDKHNQIWAKHLYPKSIFNFLQKEMSQYKKTRNKRKVYLSREDALDRKVLNQNELDIFLKDNNFETVIASKLTVKEQIQLFQNIEILITPHRAGIVNTIFSENIKIFELFPNNRGLGVTSQFYEISMILNFEHHLIMCKADNEQNVNVNLKYLKTLIK